MRTASQRSRDGATPESLAIDLTVLEANRPRVPGLRSAHRELERRIILVCNQGYCSSLAAARLRAVGARATDIEGGFEAWRAAGLPVDPLPSPRR